MEGGGVGGGVRWITISLCFIDSRLWGQSRGSQLVYLSVMGDRNVPVLENQICKMWQVLSQHRGSDLLSGVTIIFTDNITEE